MAISTKTHAISKDSLLLEAKDLFNAFNASEFRVYYQPIFATKTKTLIGLEALLRWQRLGNIIPPDHFIPLAEQSGLIHPIGEWVLRTVCQQNKLWQKMGAPLIPIAVNISLKQLENLGFATLIADILKDTGLSAKYLTLELTETLPLDLAIHQPTIEQLQQLGIEITLDDFGTGYSSFQYLKHLTINKLKIDKVFIQDIKNTKDLAIIAASIALSHQLGIKVIAEGVETLEQFEQLRLLGCDAVQGYLFSKPLTADNTTDFLKASLKEEKIEMALTQE